MCLKLLKLHSEIYLLISYKLFLIACIIKYAIDRNNHNVSFVKCCQNKNYMIYESIFCDKNEELKKLMCDNLIN